ncbi:hypothetical protein AOC05_17855 [Arthrobacter alpinus]|uniref:Uncharacterized protein n=1 Tax=Arthrobacter alpinus TaxID=656366 RepID=A0A0M4RRA8_9MICC|nr:hypothetical protein AOC05_17855 [Arthrobacter alpinus]
MHKSFRTIGAGVLLMAMALTGCSSTSRLGVDPTARTRVTAQPAKVALPPLPSPPARPSTRTRAERVEELVLEKSASIGVKITSVEWHNLSEYICGDLSKGGTGRWTPNAARVLSPENQQKLADLNLDGAILSDCPDAKGLPEWKSSYFGSPLSASLAYSESSERQSADNAYRQRILNYDREIVQYGKTYGVDISSLRPLLEGASSGYSATCRDGTVSQSGGKQGACSHHGGVNK